MTESGRTLADALSERNGDRARWRIARKPQLCGERFLDPDEIHEIGPGDSYFDTGDVIASPFVTTKLCVVHANALES